MSKQRKRSPQKLFAILLGGKHPDALLELHDLCFTLASDQKSAFQNVSTRWFGDLSTAHVDAWQEITQVDGHEMCSEELSEKNKKLFFVNVGGYVKGVFNEDHSYLFLISSSVAEAKKRAKEKMKSKLDLVHIDNSESIEQILEVIEVDESKLFWRAQDMNSKTTLPSAALKDSSIHLGYWPFRKR
jgi:hypothetical protein